jgi:hypothetical protein
MIDLIISPAAIRHGTVYPPGVQSQAGPILRLRLRMTLKVCHSEIHKCGPKNLSLRPMPYFPDIPIPWSFIPDILVI